MDTPKILPDGLQIPNRTNQIKRLKVLALAWFAVLFFGIGWQLLASGFSQNQRLLFWLGSMLAVGLGVVFLAFLSVITRNKIVFLATSLGSVAWYILVMPKDWFVAIGGAVFCLLTFWFEQRIKHDEISRADFSMSRVMRDSVSVMVYGLLAIVAFNIYAQTQVAFKHNPKRFYNQIGYYAARGLEYVPSGLGNFDPNQRFDDFVQTQAERQEPGLVKAPESQKRQVFAGVKDQLLERFHIQISGNPLLSEVVAGWVSEKVASAAGSYQKFFPAIFAVIAAALLRTVAFVFVWLTMLMSWIIFRLLLLIKFFRIEKVQVEVNKLQI